MNKIKVYQKLKIYLKTKKFFRDKSNNKIGIQFQRHDKHSKHTCFMNESSNYFIDKLYV